MPKTKRQKKDRIPSGKAVTINDPEILRITGMIAKVSRKTTQEVIKKLLLDHLSVYSDQIIARELQIESEYLSGEMPDRMYCILRGEDPPKSIIDQKNRLFPTITAKRYISGELTDEQYAIKTGTPPSEGLKDRKMANDLLNCWIEAQARQASALSETTVSKLTDRVIYSGPKRR